jgi:Bacterial Ig domain/F5/8 type C domain
MLFLPLCSWAAFFSYARAGTVLGLLTLVCGQPSRAANLTGEVIDLGSWAALNPYATASALTTNVLTLHRGRIYIGHEGANAQPNSAVYFDVGAGQYGADRDGSNNIWLLNDELITDGVVKQGDLLWMGEDNAIGTNQASLFVRRHDGWREYYSPWANAHRQAGYIFEGKVFLSNYFRTRPGVAISYDGGTSYSEIEQGSAALNAPFPLTAKYLTHAFFEIGSDLFALQWNNGTGNNAWMIRYTRNSASPWEVVHQNPPTGTGLPNPSWYKQPREFKNAWWLLARLPDASTYALNRFSLQTTSGNYGDYSRPISPAIVGNRTQAIATANGSLFRVDISTDANTLTLYRTDNGTTWAELGTLNISASSRLAYFKTQQNLYLETGSTRLEVAGADLYLGIGTRLYKISGSALGTGAPNGAANTAPVAVADAVTMLGNTTRSVEEAFYGLLANDRDPDADAFYATLVAGPTRGTLTLRYNGTYSYTPNANFSGTDSFTYSISDGYAASSASVSITVQPNTAPPPVNGRYVVRPTAATSTVISTGATNVHTSVTLIDFTINNSGLSSALNTLSALPSTPTTVTATGDGGSYVLWLSGDYPQNDQRVTLDLGATYLLTDLLLWNQTEAGVVARRSIRSANISVSSDGSSYTSLGSYTFLQGNQAAMLMQTASFPAAINARYVRFEPTQNYATYNNDGSGDRRYSFNEIRLVARPPLALPLAPSNLLASAPAANRIQLTWLDNASNETNFVLERALDGVTFSALATPAADATSYTDTGLTPNTAYTYRLRAINADGASAYTVPAAATTPLDFSTWANALPLGQRAAIDMPYSDGVTNLLRYGLGLDATRALLPGERATLPALDFGGSPAGALRLSFRLPALPPPDALYEIQSCTELNGTPLWTTLASKAGRAAWQVAAGGMAEASQGNAIAVGYTLPQPSVPRLFVRLRVSLF